MRVAIVALVCFLGHQWHDTGIGVQISWALNYAAVILVSLVASSWKQLLLLNLVLAITWLLLPLKDPAEHSWLWRVHHVFTFLNRQMGHIEAFALWLVVSLVAWPSLTAQVTGVAFVIMLGETTINALTRLTCLGGRQGVTRADLSPERRIFIYLATFAAMVWLGFLGRRQLVKLLPIFVAVSVGMVPRVVRYFRRKQRMKGEQAADLDLRQKHRVLQRVVGRHVDFLGPALVLSLLILVLVGASIARARYDRGLSGPGKAASGACDDERTGATKRTGPTTIDAELFIVSDTQLHELGGERFPGQLEFADALVPVALRPVELDLLASETLARFGAVYNSLRAERKQMGKRLPWAHLGDFADLACHAELARANKLLADFGDDLAGLAPGNHDKSFTGNFYFSTYWDPACKSGRLEKPGLEEALEKAWKPKLKERMERVPAGWLARSTGRGGALITVAPLGVTHDRNRGEGRGLLGIFLDTSDGDAFDYGIAGIFGTISDRQIHAAVRLADEIGKKQGPLYTDPVYILFFHHPIASLTGPSQGRLARLIARLDGPGAEPRVLAVITAHTHEAQAHSHCIAKRIVPEFVVGSTIDPPQQAAMVEVGPDAQNVISLRLRTIQAIARPELTCGKEPAFTSLQCEQYMAELARAPECAALFQRGGGGSGPDCQALEHGTSMRGWLGWVSTMAAVKVPIHPKDIVAEQQRRAGALFDCLCREKRCDVTPQARKLDDEAVLKLLGQRRAKKDGALELTCLSWAASALQAHKRAGMEMADTVRCAFGDTSLPPAQGYVAHLEREPCR